MFKKSCDHNFGEVDNKGYQYCTLCGKANLVGIPKCVHKFETIDIIKVKNTFTNYTIKTIYVLQCNNCGRIKEKEIT